MFVSAEILDALKAKPFIKPLSVIVQHEDHVTQYLALLSGFLYQTTQ